MSESRRVRITAEQRREARAHALMLVHHGYNDAANLLCDFADAWDAADDLADRLCSFTFVELQELVIALAPNGGTSDRAVLRSEIIAECERRHLADPALDHCSCGTVECLLHRRQRLGHSA